MGRKIPAKKHRGVKDPAQQQAKRFQSIKGKINAPPKDPDEQPVPSSLKRLFAFQETNTEQRVQKKKHFVHGNKGQNKPQRGKNPISQMKKLPGESGRSFSLRINSAIKALHGIDDQQDYPLDLEEDEDMKGERMDAQRRRRERKRKRGGAAAAGDEDVALPSRARRLALKKEARKQKELEAKQDQREVVYERVGFGEVAHAPPALNFKSKKHGKDDGAPRPGRRDLLLSKMLDKGAAAAAAAAAAARSRARSLPAAERWRRERARQAAVDAYRALKANAIKQPNKT